MLSHTSRCIRGQSKRLGNAKLKGREVCGVRQLQCRDMYSTVREGYLSCTLSRTLKHSTVQSVTYLSFVCLAVSPGCNVPACVSPHFGTEHRQQNLTLLLCSGSSPRDFCMACTTVAIRCTSADTALKALKLPKNPTYGIGTCHGDQYATDYSTLP